MLDRTMHMHQEQLCLSHWQISQLVMKILPESEVQRCQQHVAVCQLCEQAVSDEYTAHQQAQLSVVPQSVLAQGVLARSTYWDVVREWFSALQRPRWLSVKSTATYALGSLCVVGLAIVVTRVQGPSKQADLTQRGAESVWTKGRFALHVEVWRQNERVQKPVPIAHLSDWRSGDILRLQVRGVMHPWLVLQSWQAGRWADYYRGLLPADGWLPLRLQLQAGSATKLRVWNCDKNTGKPTLSTCVRRDIDFARLKRE